MSKKEFIFVLIVTFIVFVIWIIADTLHNRSQITIDPKYETLTKPIETNFDSSALDMLNK